MNLCILRNTMSRYFTSSFDILFRRSSFATTRFLIKVEKAEIAYRWFHQSRIPWSHQSRSSCSVEAILMHFVWNGLKWEFLTSEVSRSCFFCDASLSAITSSRWSWANWILSASSCLNSSKWPDFRPGLSAKKRNNTRKFCWKAYQARETTTARSCQSCSLGWSSVPQEVPSCASTGGCRSSWRSRHGWRLASLQPGCWCSHLWSPPWDQEYQRGRKF